MAIVTMNRFEFVGDNGTFTRIDVAADGSGKVSVITVEGRHVRGCCKLPAAAVSLLVDTLVNARADGVIL